MSKAVWTLVAAVAVVAIAGVGVLAAVLSQRSTPAAAPVSSASPTAPIAPDDASGRSADQLGEEFLADWVDPDGRVVRRDQGDDTVSEGQAYGLTISLGVSDEKSFDEIWNWTKDNLMLDDGLLAWRWVDGAIADDEPAADADLDAARALVLAGVEFDRPDLTEEGNQLGGRILDRMTAETALGRILLPGPWATATQPYAYNPSYASPAAFTVLQQSSGDPRWGELQTGSAAVTTAILAQTDLPPDWAQVSSDGTVNPTPGAASTGTDVRYSYDAARLALRYTESCEPTDVALAADLAPTLARNDALAADLDLGGGALGSAQSPLGYAARAASLAASGDDTAAEADLARSVALLDEVPTYYGAAWAAIAPLMLETDRLGGCPQLEEATR